MSSVNFKTKLSSVDFYTFSTFLATGSTESVDGIKTVFEINVLANLTSDHRLIQRINNTLESTLFKVASFIHFNGN